jgi:hypothetical protein
MRYRKIYDGVLMAFLVDRCGNDDRMEDADVQVGRGRRAVIELNPMPMLSNAHGSPLGDLSRLAFRRSVDDQDIHTVSPPVAGGLKLPSAYLVAGI